jgi:acylphosphatase
MVRGTEEQLQKLHEWLLHGPKNARIDHLVCEEAADTEYLYFEIK